MSHVGIRIESCQENMSLKKKWKEFLQNKFYFGNLYNYLLFFKGCYDSSSEWLSFF